MGTNHITGDSDLDDIIHSASTALIAAIPGIGGSLASLRSSYYTGHKINRYSEFILGLKNDVENLKDQINNDYVALDQFFDIFEFTAKTIMETRQAEKRNIFRRILKNSIISNDTNYNETEALLKLMEKLRIEHILFLRIFSDPHKYNEEQGKKIIKGNYLTVTPMHILSKLVPDWNKDDIIEIIKDLENERLVKDFTDNANVMMSQDGLQIIANKLTNKGKRFCHFILE